MRTRAMGVGMIAAVAAVLALMAGGSNSARAHHADDIVHAGYDLLATDDGTSIDAWPVAVPGLLFGPGCDDFADPVSFEGVPFDTFDPPGPAGPFTGLTPTDTIVERLEDAGTTFPDTIDIEIVRLELVSVAPITVTGCTIGGDPQQWDVEAQVPEGDTYQNPGTMTIRHEHANGGTFDAEFPVDPLITFTKVGGGGQIGPVHLSDVGYPVFVLSTSGAHWCHEATVTGPRIILDPAHPPNFFPAIDCGSNVTATGEPFEEEELPPWEGKHAVKPVAGPVGGTVELLTGDTETLSAESTGSGGADATLPVLSAVGGAVVALAAGGWYVRRRMAR